MWWAECCIRCNRSCVSANDEHTNTQLRIVQPQPWPVEPSTARQNTLISPVPRCAKRELWKHGGGGTSDRYRRADFYWGGSLWPNIPSDRRSLPGCLPLIIQIDCAAGGRVGEGLSAGLGWLKRGARGEDAEWFCICIDLIAFTTQRTEFWS